MSARKCSRAAAKLPRVKSLWARSKALSAAASSREGWRGGFGAWRGAALWAAGALFDAAAFEALAGACFAGCDWDFAGLFRAGAAFDAAARGLAPAFLAAADFA